jgi:predicted metalloprotease with PDZ domain
MPHIRTENAAIFSADSFYKLTAAPMVASPTLQEVTYQIENLTTVFHIWIQGKWQPDTEQIIADFQAFTTKQVELFAGNSNIETAFPATDYHFIFIILPYYYHHGVEHYNSTMLVMGVPPNYDFHSKQYNEVLSISSHELFHFWNICRIRPVEMLPYDYTKENYFPTGFVAEGITTYYGDYMLLRSGIWNFAEYSKSFEQLLQRHFDNFGRYAYSLTASSWDLWLDGYVAGIPNRKVSIYNEGALAAWVLDIEIRFLSNNTKSLDDVLRILWNDFALQNRGYSLQDYQNIVEQVAGKSMQKYFDDCILGVGKIEHYLQATIQHIGYQILANKNPRIEEQVFGFRIAVRESKLFVSLIAPNSPADEFLSLQDELLSIDNQVVEPRLVHTLLQGKKEITLQIIRKQKLKTIRLQANNQQYLPIYSIEKLQNVTEKQTNCLKKWLV